MGVKTEADEKIDFARKKMQEALEAVNDAHTNLVIKPCWGAEEFSTEFKNDLLVVQTDLVKTSQRLGKRIYFD
jgi:hypothetical protein